MGSNDVTATQSALLRASQPASEAFFSTLVTANHILHHNGVVDAFGHVSARNPQDPSTFFISRDLAPALVSGRADLEEYRVDDASPVREDAPKGYAERFIHSEIYKKYPGVHSVVHAHSEAVLPFGISSVPLRPIFNVGSVMGAHVPVWDISRHYRNGSDDQHSLMVTNSHLGVALATEFNAAATTSTQQQAGGIATQAASLVKDYVAAQVSSLSSTTAVFPSHPTVLMRGHGFTSVGASVEEVILRAVFTCTNARAQTTSLLMQGGHNMGLAMAQLSQRNEEQSGTVASAEQPGIKYLSDRECADAWKGIQNNSGRPWKLWCAEVANSPLYRNELPAPPGA